MTEKWAPLEFLFFEMHVRSTQVCPVYVSWCSHLHNLWQYHLWTSEIFFNYIFAHKIHRILKMEWCWANKIWAHFYFIHFFVLIWKVPILKDGPFLSEVFFITKFFHNYISKVKVSLFLRAWKCSILKDTSFLWTHSFL